MAKVVKVKATRRNGKIVKAHFRTVKGVATKTGAGKELASKRQATKAAEPIGNITKTTVLAFDYQRDGGKGFSKKLKELQAGDPNLVHATVHRSSHSVPQALIKATPKNKHHTKITYSGEKGQRDMFSKLLKKAGIEHSKASTKQLNGLKATHLIVTPKDVAAKAHQLKMAYYKKHRER
jgi:hypothetical protein